MAIMGLYVKGEESLLVLKGEGDGVSQIFHLEGAEECGFQFYGRFRRFEAGLTQDAQLSEQPYGKIGASCDLTGRAAGALAGGEQRLIATQGKKILTLEQPVYSKVGEYSDSELNDVLEGYVPEQRDVPYASITISAYGGGWAGDDLYQNTLFFMTGGYGIIAETSAVAGRDIEDCCSPEFHYAAHKVDLDDLEAITQLMELEPVSGAVLAQLRVSVTPGIVPEFTIKPEDWPSATGKLEEIAKSLHS